MKCATSEAIETFSSVPMGELTRPQNRPVLRLRESPLLQDLAKDILRKVHRLKPILP
jgi:hypothetical protein